MTDVDVTIQKVAELIFSVKPCGFQSQQWFDQRSAAKRRIEELVGYLANDSRAELQTTKVYDAVMGALSSSLEGRIGTMEQLILTLRTAVEE